MTRKPACERIPLTVIGGFLGAGKTTLLHRLLEETQGRRVAVLVNDFGAINIDAGLSAERGAHAIELTNGCVCCSIGDDLSAALIGLIESERPPDAIVIESSGVSDPWRIAQVGLADAALALEAVLVLVDASAFMRLAQDPLLGDTLQRQLRAADLLVLNHCDHASAGELQALREHLEVTVPRTPRVETTQASVAGVLLGGPLSAVPHGQAHHDCACGHERHEHDHHLGHHGDVHHEQIFENWSRVHDGVHRAQALRTMLRNMPQGVMRLKGHVRTDEHGLAVLQFAGTHGSLRAATPTTHAAVAPTLVAIGLQGRLPRTLLDQALADSLQPVPAPVAL